MNNIQERINLDWLRGAAALTVAALHCREIGWVGLREFHRVQRDQGLLDMVLAYISRRWVFCVAASYLLYLLFERPSIQ